MENTACILKLYQRKRKKRLMDRFRIHVRRHCDYGKNGTFIIL